MHFLHGGEKSSAALLCATATRCLLRSGVLKREQVTGDDGLNYSEHKCNDDSQAKQPAVYLAPSPALTLSPNPWPSRLTLPSQMIFDEFVELVTRRARAMCGGGVALPEAIAAQIGAETIPKLQRCQLVAS